MSPRLASGEQEPRHLGIQPRSLQTFSAKARGLHGEGGGSASSLSFG